LLAINTDLAKVIPILSLSPSYSFIQVEEVSVLTRVGQAGRHHFVPRGCIFKELPLHCLTSSEPSRLPAPLQSTGPALLGSRSGLSGIKVAKAQRLPSTHSKGDTE